MTAAHAVALVQGVALAFIAFAQEEAPGGPAPSAMGGVVPLAEPKNEYLLSDQNLFEGVRVGWEGFLTGMEGFDHFHDPISNPIYHEAATIDSQLKFLFIHHEFPDDGVLQGGNADIVALQARLAITERFALIATKDGYTWFEPGIYAKEQEGFNDVAAGAKYAVWVSEEHDAIVTLGARYQWRTGAERVFQGNAEEFSPFVSAAKGFDKLHLLGNVSWRIGVDQGDSNDVLQWSLHADYEIAKGFAPVAELNGLHYLDNGSRLALPVGGADYGNFGSNDVEGDTVVSLALGASAKLTPNVTLGATYEFPLTNPSNDIIENRVMVALTLGF